MNKALKHGALLDRDEGSYWPKWYAFMFTHSMKTDRFVPNPNR